MNKNENLDVNSYMNTAKCIAIVTVIMAHSRNTGYYFYSNLTERIGAIGVVIFFIIAGYYFNVEKYGIKFFFIKKIRSILLPWLLTGTIVYLISHSFNFLDWLNWIIGNGTYLYYLSMLMLCYLFLSFFNQKIHIILFLLLNIISLLATSFGVIDYLFLKYFGVIEINNYLNLFNWIGFFSKNYIKNVMLFLKKKIIIILVTYGLFLTIGFYLEPNYSGYFSRLAIPTELFGVICIFSISTIKWLNNKYTYSLTELIFAIYLTHFLTFPVRKFLIHNLFTEFVNPFIFMGVNCFLLLSGLYISRKINLEKLYCILLGIRMEKVEDKNLQRANEQ